ncbi:hypothetical protein JL720_10690 [Aureococcus anophagefferens]|nr:hypothetical protein JL720_10690 [Aureococcus anophagefferens]
MNKILVALALLTPSASAMSCALDTSVDGATTAIGSGSKIRFVGLTPSITRHHTSGADQVVVTGASSAYTVSTDADGTISDGAASAGPSWLRVAAAGAACSVPGAPARPRPRPARAADMCTVIEVEIHTSDHDESAASEAVNPCIDAALGYAPLRDDLANVPCDDAGAQSATDVTVGAVGEMDPGLDPIEDYNAMGMCTVNIHWHIGAEHRSEGVYDETFDFDHPALHDDDAHRKLAWTNGKQRPNGRRKLAGGRVGHMCKNAKDMHDANDPMVANEYDWKYCEGMHVGLTYEFHWPHSSLGACQTEWQYQYHFLDGVLCGATQGNVDIATASALLSDRTHGIGVEGQVYTIVNSDDGAHKHATWSALDGWNKELATDYAWYQGSTTGDAADNEICRGTGGLVTWHQDRQCHLLEASTMDNICRQMLVISADDMSPDVAPHGARETVSASLSDTPYTP